MHIASNGVVPLPGKNSKIMEDTPSGLSAMTTTFKSVLTRERC